jgi:hypothetical protein
VYPFAWEAYHNGSTLLTHADAIIDFLSPFNSGADGLVIWGSTRTSDRTGKAVFPAQGGPNTQTYFDYVRKSTGPLIAGFQAKLLSCSKAQCSGHGRCTAVHLTGRALAHDGIPCACFDGFFGDHCEEQQQLPPPTKTDDATDAVTVATAPPHVDPMACYTLRSRTISACVSAESGVLLWLRSEEGRAAGTLNTGQPGAGTHALDGSRSGTVLLGCTTVSTTVACEPAADAAADHDNCTSVLVRRDVVCDQSYWNRRGGQHALIVEEFQTGFAGALSWRATVASTAHQPWTTAITTQLHFSDFSNDTLWVGGPRVDNATSASFDPLVGFTPLSGRINQAYGGAITSNTFQTPEADWAVSSDSGAPLPLAVRLTPSSGSGISFAQDAADSPITAQLIVTRSERDGVHAADDAVQHRAGRWAIANEYNAIFGNDTSGASAMIPVLGADVAGFNLCQDLCDRHPTCDIFVWSGNTKNCWGRLDNVWAAPYTLHDEPNHISGCILGNVGNCGHNPIAGPHPPLPPPVAPPEQKGPGGKRLSFNYSRQFTRLGGGAPPAVFTSYLYGHADCWRPAVGWMFNQFRQHFRIHPSVNLSEIEGGGSYANFRGSGWSSADVTKYRHMGLRLNWDASFAYPYHGMWLPEAETWTTCFEHNSDRQLGPPGTCSNVSVAEIASWYSKMRSFGFRTCAYANLFEFGDSATEPNTTEPGCLSKNYSDNTIPMSTPCSNIVGQLPICRRIHCDSQRLLREQLGNAPVRDLRGQLLGGGAGGSIIMDPGSAQYQNHIMAMGKRLLERTPTTGLCVDRQDWVGVLNSARDDPRTCAHDIVPLLSMCPIFVCFVSILIVRHHRVRNADESGRPWRDANDRELETNDGPAGTIVSLKA